RPIRQREPGFPETGRIEDLNSWPSFWRVGDGESAVRRRRERRRPDDSAGLGANLDDLPGAVEGFVDGEHAMRPSIEHVVVLPCRRLLKCPDVAEPAGDVRRDRPDRTQELRGER